jgi:hypothetical protein
MTFTDEMIFDLKYEINDEEITNDFLAVIGDLGSEVLVRGVSSDSIALFGRRSFRIPQPIGKDQATVESLLTEKLNKYDGITVNKNIPVVSFSLTNVNSTIMTQILTLNIGDKVTLEISKAYLNQDFWIDSVSLSISSGILKATYECTALRDGEG